VLARVRKQVLELAEAFPLYPERRARAQAEAIIDGRPLPPKGSVIGAGVSTVCGECRRRKEDKRVSRFHRVWEIETDPERCLLEQGIPCMGVATRDGCGALCPQVNMPCIGCYGSPEGVLDQGARMVAALGSVLDLESEGALRSLEQAVPDAAGTLYRFSLAHSILGGRR
jgi:F420-non-reducing hydrogenase small subunit